jgi:hypothetical protein
LRSGPRDPESPCSTDSQGSAVGRLDARRNSLRKIVTNLNLRLERWTEWNFCRLNFIRLFGRQIAGNPLVHRREQAQSSRSLIAERILKMAATGERDPIRLRTRALTEAVASPLTADASRGQTKKVSHEFCRSDQLMLPQLCQFLRSSSSFGVLVLVSFRSHCFDCVWCNR